MGIDAAMELVHESLTWGYCTGLGFVLLILMARRSGGR